MIFAKFVEYNPYFAKIMEYTKIPKHFSEAYPDARFKVITPDNFEEFVLVQFKK